MSTKYSSSCAYEPRPGTLYLSSGRTVLATDEEGFVRDGSAHGLFVHETRMLSRHVLLINGATPRPNALSNVEQHSWLGYYLVPLPGVRAENDSGSGQVPDASQHPLETRVSRVAVNDLHDDIDITNFSQKEISGKGDEPDSGDRDSSATRGSDLPQSKDKAMG